MGRTKAPPRVAQPDLERQAFTPEAQTMSAAINEYQATNSHVIDDEIDHHAEKPILPKMATITGSQKPPALERSAAEEIVNIGHRLALKHVTCPHCRSRFPDMGITKFREHIESCSRPVTGDSESTTSSLSPPPDSHHGDDGDDESADLDHLTAYVTGALTSYPEIKADANGDMETADAQSRTHFARLTDAQKFIESLDDMEDLPYEVLFSRVRNASEAVIHWQNEWMDLDRFIEVTEPLGQTTKSHKNPRIPKDTQIGIGYRDELESFVYGFEYQYHQTKVGKQNPLRQRYTNGANGGRELRQRIPTQKAVEADLSTSPDSDEGVGTRRRGRRQKLKEGTPDVESAVGGRGQRGRNGSRIDSQSRDQTPTSTFPSGKKRGRPAKPKVGGASRLQELQREEGFEYDSTPEPSQNQQVPNNTESPGSLTRKRSYGFHETLETTENWQEDTEQDEPASRPGTSDSTMTGLSDDMRNPPAKSSGKGRKRQNTSDFEDALPSYKRIRKMNNPAANGLSELDLAQSTKDSNNAEKTRNTRRARQEENVLRREIVTPEVNLAHSTSKSNDSKDTRALSGSKSDNAMQKNQNGKERKIITLKTSNGMSRTPANAALAKDAATDPLPGTIAQQDGKDGPKVSRASLNMMRRWAAKKQAEALGLPVPKIGRYPKGGSAPSTPDVAGVPDPFNPPKLGGRKRKRDEEEPNAANVSVSDAIAGNIEAPVNIKKRGGRPKKITNLEPPLDAEPAGQHTINEDDQPTASVSDREDTKHEEPAVDVVPKRKGGRPRKKPIVVENPVQDIQGGPEQIRHTSLAIENNQGSAGSTKAIVSPHDIDSTNEDTGGAQPQLRRTTRVRRQTSAALSASSQANTQRSDRSSQKSTVTPTPAPTQQLGEEAVIKQEMVSGPALPRKRGRQPKSAKVDTASDAAIDVPNVTEDEAPPPKRRRVGRTTKLMSTGSTPAVSDEEGTTPQEDATASQKRGPQKTKAFVPDNPASEVLSDGQVPLADTSLHRKRSVKNPTMDLPTAPGPSATPGSSVEPLVPKRKGGRPRKNPNVSGRVADVSVKAEDLAHLPELLTTGVRSSGHDSAVQVNPTEESMVGRQTADHDPPKKKGNWGGKRVKGVFASGNPPKPIITTGAYTSNGLVGAEEHAQSNRTDGLGTSVQERLRRVPLDEFPNKNAHPEAVAFSDETGADATDPAAPSITPTRPKRFISKPAALVGEVSDHDLEIERPTFSPSRPKRATTIAETSGRETSLDGTSAGTLPRPKRAVTTSVAARGEMTINDIIPGMSSNTLSRPKRAAPVPASLEDVGEASIDGSAHESLSRPKRVVTMKISPAGALAIDNAEKSPHAILGRDSIDSEPNTNLEKLKGPWGGKRVKVAKAADEDVAAKVESDNEGSDSDATRKEKMALAAKASKAMKNSQSMKARWANGSMHEVMRRKREANLAKKAAAAQAVENGEVEELRAAPASAPSKRKAASTKAVASAPKRRRTMNATMDGPADSDDEEYDTPTASSSGPTSPTSRKVSEYERFKQLSSSLRSSQGRRKRRPAALRASQSFSKFTDEGEGDDVEMMDNEDEDVETELKKQFDSEYGHFRAVTPPSHRYLQSSNILPGKRKPKPVINLAEAMRIEAGDEDDFFMEG